MPKSKYTKEMYLFLKQNINGKWFSELTKMFNEHFQCNFTKNQIKNFCARNGLNTGMQGKGAGPIASEKIKLLNKEQDAYLRSIVKDSTYVIITDNLNKKFGLNITISQIKGYMSRYHISTGTKGQYKKGHIPFNKGKKMSQEMYQKVSKTMFKKGNVPVNYKPVGSERITQDGYIEVKVKDPNKWKLKHRLVWEKVNGPIQKNQVVIFLDGNKKNCSIDNLYLVSRQVHVRMCQNNLYSNEKEITMQSLKVAELICKKGQIKRKYKKR